MKLTVTTLIAALVASMALVATAQDSEKKGPEAKAPGEREQPRRGGPGGRGGRGDMLSRLPVYKALDADGNGEISAEEIKNAAVALKALDKDGDGKLSREEISPAWGGRGGDRQRGGDRAGGRQRGGGGEGGRPERPQRPKRPSADDQ